MAFSELELKRYEKITKDFIEKRRPPIHIRNKVDLGYKIKDYSIEIFEIRSKWDDPKIIIEVSIAKTKCINKNNSWKIYWKMSDLKWHEYEPNQEVILLRNL